MVPRSSFAATEITLGSFYDVQEVANQSAKITEIAVVANHEVAKIGGHAIGTMAKLVDGANLVRRQLTMSGHSSEIYDDAQGKILQVTGQNIITLANTAQKEVLQQAAQLMR
jgi:hypothetical protein